MRWIVLPLTLAAIVAGCGDAGDPTVTPPSGGPTEQPTGTDPPLGAPGRETPEEPTTDPTSGDGSEGGDGAGEGSPGDDDTGDPTGEDGDVGEDGGEDAATGVDQGWIDAAKQDLAASLGVPVGDIVVLEGGRVEWSDSSLGCPEPGRSYLQVITPGYRLVLGVDGQRHHYHGAEDRAPFRCEDPQEPSSSSDR